MGVKAGSLPIGTALALVLSAGAAQPDSLPATFAAEYQVDGKSFTADDVPTFSLDSSGLIDGFAANGYRVYQASCRSCHGEDALGGLAPAALTEQVADLEFAEYLDVVSNGRIGISDGKPAVMPSFGTNPRVMCFVDDIYIYLRARLAGTLPPGLPVGARNKPPAAIAADEACIGG